MKNKLIALLYNWLGLDAGNAQNDMVLGYLTRNTGRDGKEYYWYDDGVLCAVIDMSGNIIDDETTIEELFL